MPGFLTPLPEGTESEGQGRSVKRGRPERREHSEKAEQGQSSGGKAESTPPCIPSPPWRGSSVQPEPSTRHPAATTSSRPRSSLGSRSCHLLRPAAGHTARSDAGGGADRLPPCCCLQPSPSPTRLIAIVRAAEQPGVIGEFVVLGEGTRTCPKPRIRHQEGGLSSVRGGGKERAAVSCQPGRWCQQRRG